MQWNDLEALIEQGHTIGCHTKKHASLSNCRSEEELEGEIIVSADHLMGKLGCNIEHFAYSFGGINSFSREALAIAKRRFSFIYTGIRGNNVKVCSPFAIRRDTVAYQLKDNKYRLFNKKLLSVFLNGFLDFLYGPAREKIDTWCK